MGAAAGVMTELGILGKPEPQPVRSRNRPPARANVVMHKIFGNAVKETIERMETYPYASEVQEQCCIKLMHLARSGGARTLLPVYIYFA